MVNNSQMNKALIRNDGSKQLALPLEMIQSGLELAIRIEQKLGIQQTSETINRPEYLVQCYPTVMKWVQGTSNSLKLIETDKNFFKGAVYVVMSIESEGLQISCPLKSENLITSSIEENGKYYRLLNSSNSLEPFAIPFSSFSIFYNLVTPLDKSKASSIGRISQIPKEKLKHFKFSISPTGQPGYKGPITNNANRYYDINRDYVEIVIVYISVFQNSNTIIAKDPPLKIKFVVLDDKGEDDENATYDLYHDILNTQESFLDTR